MRKKKTARTQLTEDEVDERQKQKEAEYARANSRTLSNTGFSKRYHKPPFGAYGTGNLRPVDGGLMYGNYMTSYSVAPLMHPANPKSEVSQARLSQGITQHMRRNRSCGVTSRRSLWVGGWRSGTWRK